MTLSEKLDQQEAEIAKRRKLLRRFPDLREQVDRWKTVRLYSKAVNAIAVEAQIHHTCGCCADAPLVVRPYVRVDGECIYSDPPEIYIGHRNYWGGGDVLVPDWRHRLSEAGLSAEVAEIVSRCGKEEEP
jgi:hypothetical protein